MKSPAETQKGLGDAECETYPIPNGADLLASAQCKMMRLAIETLALSTTRNDPEKRLNWKHIQQTEAMKLNCEPGNRRF